MAHVITENCIKCKYTDCVQVCPVDCFYEGENMLVINPDECIDCGICVFECPAEAIVCEDKEDEKKWLIFNKKYSAIWPKITYKKPAFDDAGNWKNKSNKLVSEFSDRPGEGSIQTLTQQR